MKYSKFYELMSIPRIGRLFMPQNSEQTSLLKENFPKLEKVSPEDFIKQFPKSAYQLEKSAYHLSEKHFEEFISEKSKAKYLVFRFENDYLPLEQCPVYKLKSLNNSELFTLIQSFLLRYNMLGREIQLEQKDETLSISGDLQLRRTRKD